MRNIKSYEDFINESKNQIIVIVNDKKRLALQSKDDLKRLKSGKDVVAKSLKHPGQEEWITKADKWKLEESLEEILNETYKTQKEAELAAQKLSKEEGVVQHVNQLRNGHFEISDWYDDEDNVASYENGRKL